MNRQSKFLTFSAFLMKRRSWGTEKENWSAKPGNRRGAYSFLSECFDEWLNYILLGDINNSALRNPFDLFILSCFDLLIVRVLLDLFLRRQLLNLLLSGSCESPEATEMMWMVNLRPRSRWDWPENQKKKVCQKSDPLLFFSRCRRMEWRGV